MHHDGGPVTLGFTGVGGRGGVLLGDCVGMDDVTIAAVCDRLDDNVEAAQETVTDAGGAAPDGYGDHGTMVREANLDGVIIVTDWRRHIELAIEAMEAGVFAAIEVGPANTVEECWDLVKTRARTGTPCMLLENYCFRRETMAVLNMVRQGLFGELVHCQGGYGHDLRERIVEGKGTGIQLPDGGDYRTRQVESRNADLYPTHGLGPLSKMLEVNRGNRLVSLTSTPSKATSLREWTRENRDRDHPKATTEWANGDMVTTVLRTANGETVVLYHDTVLPRPFSTMHRVQGTQGLWEEDADAIYVDGRSPHHEWEDAEPYFEEFEHPLWERAKADHAAALEESGHWGADFLMLRSLVTCLKQGRRPPIDVYDAATWCAVAPLTAESIQKGGDPVSIPDFTNGAWLQSDPIFYDPSSDASHLEPEQVL